jgi:dimethylhistidine N-methyltransferase
MIPVCDRSLSPFRADVLRGLSASARALPCKYFYDQTGSELFERITRLEEYYPTRTELAILQRHACQMAGLLGHCLLIEYGSGSSTKTRLLLDHLRHPAGYVPIDVSGEHLRRTARVIAEQYPEIDVYPVCADFTASLQQLLPRTRPLRRVIFFPGSTIGNFTPQEAVRLLRQSARLCGRDGGLLLGADLQKDPAVIESAYNDGQGVTAAFNRNLLARINRELQGTFLIEQFTHQAFYNAGQGRIEMYLVSSCNQRAWVGDIQFSFAAGETIHTEYSYKYTLPQLHRLARAAGFEITRSWMDQARYFSVHYLTVPQPGASKTS